MHILNFKDFFSKLSIGYQDNLKFDNASAGSAVTNSNGKSTRPPPALTLNVGLFVNMIRGRLIG